MGKFIIKHINNKKPQIKPNLVLSGNTNVIKNENKKKINEEVMTTSEKIAMAQSILNDAVKSVSFKKLKRDKGLIERTESSKTILTEDNKELLND